MALPKGWALPAGSYSRKYHYFDGDSICLCRKWLYTGVGAEDTNDEHPDNCVACKRKKAKLDKKRNEQ